MILNRLTIAQIRPLLVILNAGSAPTKKADIVEKLLSALNQRVASYNDALKSNQAHVVELYWRQLREVLQKINESKATLIVYWASGGIALPVQSTPTTPATPAAPVAHPTPAVPRTTSYPAAPPQPYNYRPSYAPPPTHTHNMAPDSPGRLGVKRKREEEVGVAPGLPGGPPLLKRPAFTPAPPLTSAMPSYSVASSTMSTPRTGNIPGTNVCVDELDDPFYRLAPYPPLASVQLEASPPHLVNTAKSKAFSINLPEPTWRSTQGPSATAKVIMRCFVITPLKPGQPWEPAKHSWPTGAYIFVNNTYVDITKLRKDEKKKTLEMPLDLSPYVKAGHSNINFQSSSGMHYQVVVQVMRIVPVDDLVAQTKDKFTISFADGRQHVLNSFRANGDDLIEMKKKISLNDPLVLTRIKTPARGTACKHIGCFDLTNYLLMNERIRTWRCPVCNSDCPFKTVIVDGWTERILDALASSEDSEFVVYPDATWTDTKGRSYEGGAPSQQPTTSAAAAAAPAPARAAVGTFSITPASARPAPVEFIAIDDSDSEDLNVEPKAAPAPAPQRTTYNHESTDDPSSTEHHASTQRSNSVGIDTLLPSYQNLHAAVASTASSSNGLFTHASPSMAYLSPVSQFNWMTARATPPPPAADDVIDLTEDD